MLVKKLNINATTPFPNLPHQADDKEDFGLQL